MTLNTAEAHPVGTREGVSRLMSRAPGNMPACQRLCGALGAGDLGADEGRGSHARMRLRRRATQNKSSALPAGAEGDRDEGEELSCDGDSYLRL